MSFGEKLYQLRVERGIYQKELAVYLKVSVGTISNYENGVHSPDLDALCLIADYFHVSVDYLLGRTEYTAPLEELNEELVNQYTVGSILNTIIELSPDSRQNLVKYLTMLKLYEENVARLEQTDPDDDEPSED